MAWGNNTLMPQPGSTPTRGVGVGERSPLAGHEEVALEGELEPTRDGGTVDGADHGLGRAGPGTPGPIGGAGGEADGAARATGPELGEVEAGAEGGVCARQHDDGNLVVSIDGGHGRTKGARQLGVERVAAIGPIERDDGDAVGDVDEEHGDHRGDATVRRVRSNPWLERRILNWAHQGGAKEAPSSTLFAMREAVANGAHAIELDVHMSADGVLMVCHDATVDRTTNGSGAIAALTLAELRALDNAYWWTEGSVVDHDNPDPGAYVHRGKAADDSDFRIATLDEVLTAFPDTYLNFDIKQTAPAVPSYEEPLAAALRDHGRAGKTIVASFNDLATDRFRALAPEFDTSLGTNGTAEFYRAVRAGQEPPETPAVALQVPHTFGDTVLVDADFVVAAHAAGLAVHVWTIDDDEEMAELIGLGVDGVMTDRPTALAAQLAKVSEDRRS